MIFVFLSTANSCKNDLVSLHFNHSSQCVMCLMFNILKSTCIYCCEGNFILGCHCVQRRVGGGDVPSEVCYLVLKVTECNILQCQLLRCVSPEKFNNFNTFQMLHILKT